MSEVELNRNEHNFIFFGSQKVRRCNNCNELENSASEFCHTRDSLLDDVAKLRQQLEAAQAKAKRRAPCEHACEARAFEIEIRQLNAENKRLQLIIKKAQEQTISAEVGGAYKGAFEVGNIIFCADKQPLQTGTKLYALPPIPAEHGEQIKRYESALETIKYVCKNIGISQAGMKTIYDTCVYASAQSEVKPS